MLGRPSAKAKVRYTDGQMSFDSYKVQEGTIAGLMDDRVFYRNDGVVAWIEAVVADRDGRTHKLQEIVDQLGSTLDQVYVNNNLRSSTQYDILAGPDQIYVWSECGFATGAAPRTADSIGGGSQLVIRHPISVGDYSFQPRPNVEDEIVFELIFPPTSFAGFEEFYKEKVPFRFYYVATQYFGHETK